MPLTCRGRVRGLEPSRGDVDDALGKLVSSFLVLFYILKSSIFDLIPMHMHD